MDPGKHCDFRPFIATDDGTCLVLLRRRNFAFWAIRVCLYLLLVPALAIFVLIPYAMWAKLQSHGLTPGVFAMPILLLLGWVVVKLMLYGFKLEGTRRIVCRPGSLTLEGRGALLRYREQRQGFAALEARTIRQSTEYGDVRWLKLSLRGPSKSTDLGHLALDRDAEPIREARVQAAAALMATRLQVPLHLTGEHGEQAKQPKQDELITPITPP